MHPSKTTSGCDRQTHAPLIDQLRHIKLRTRLTAAFLLVSLIPFTVFMLFSVRVYTSSIQDKLTLATKQSTQILSNDLSLVLNSYSNFISTLSVSDEVQDALSTQDFWLNELGLYQMSQSLKILIQTLPLSAVLPTRDICIVDTNLNAIYSHGYVYLDHASLESIIQQTDIFSPKDHLQFSKAYNGDLLLSLSRKVYDANFTATHVGYIIIFISVSVFSDLFPVSALGEGATMMLADSAGNVLSAQDKSLIGQSLINEPYYNDMIHSTKNGNYTEIINDEKIITFTYNSAYNIYMISTIPSTFIRSEIMRVQRIIVFAAIPLILICILLTTLIYCSITLPIHHIIRVYTINGDDIPTERARDKSPDELGVLARTIDNLADRNQNMLECVRDSDRRKRELELEMLQYQINPHFLFNTLGTLKWIATLHDDPVLSDGISSLSALLQTTLISKEEFVTLESEISCLKNYCSIQALRYTGQFEIRYFVAHCVEHCLIPRFILQPLVENAIIHAIGEKDDAVNISIFAECVENHLHIFVKDNGVGFNVDKIIDKETGQFNGIGLSNVDSRLRLYYGASHGLQIQSHPNEGTTCHIVIPSVTKEGNDITDVQSFDR